MAPFIKNIYESHISNSNSIILYVAAAVSDLTTGQSLEIARNNDPEIKRTLTIVTKIDRREPSTFQKQLAEVNIGLGAILVRNRTQDEVEKNLPFNELLEREKLALSERDLLQVSDTCKGIPRLVSQLVKLQKDMLLQFKPVLRKKLDEIKRQKRRELEKMPLNYKTDTEKNQVFVTLMQNFASQLKNVVTNNRNEIPNEKWFLRGKLKQILDEHQQDMSNLQFELF